MQMKHEYDQNVHIIYFGQEVLDYMKFIAGFEAKGTFCTPKNDR